MTKLREKMIDDLVVRGRAAATQQAYVRSVVRLAAHYHRSPDRITDEEIQTYLAHLGRGLAWN